jgi:hypothetical protein
MEGVKNRKLDEYFQLEEGLEKQTTSDILAILQKSDTSGDPQDLLRLFLQWYIQSPADLTRQEMDAFTKALEAHGVDTAAVNYVKSVRQLTRMAMISTSTAAPSQPQSNQLWSSLSSHITSQFKVSKLAR